MGKVFDTFVSVAIADLCLTGCSSRLTGREIKKGWVVRLQKNELTGISHQSARLLWNAVCSSEQAHMRLSAETLFFHPLVGLSLHLPRARLSRSAPARIEN